MGALGWPLARLRMSDDEPYITRWECTPPPVGREYLVTHETWHEGKGMALDVRAIHGVLLLSTPAERRRHGDTGGRLLTDEEVAQAEAEMGHRL